MSGSALFQDSTTRAPTRYGGLTLDPSSNKATIESGETLEVLGIADFSGASSVSYLADSIGEPDVEWATPGSAPAGTEIGAVHVPLEDTGGYFPTDNVEAATQLMASQISGLTSGLQLKFTVWANPEGTVFNDADGQRQWQGLIFPGIAGVGDTFNVDDGTTSETWTGVSGTPAANQFDVSGTINDMVESLVTRINIDSALVKADYGLVSDVDSNYMMFLGTQAIEAKIYTWAQDVGTGDWTAGQPKYSTDALDSASEFTALSNTDPDTMQFNVGVAQATLQNGWAYPVRGGSKAGAVYAYDQDDDQWTLFIPPNTNPIQAGTGIDLDTTTDPNTVSFDQSANLTSLDGTWTWLTGGIADFATSADEDALRIPTGTVAPTATTLGAIYGDTSANILYCYLDAWHAYLGIGDAGTITGLWTFDRDPGAPFAVSSGSAVVPNLDADKVDGFEASDLFNLDNANVSGVLDVNHGGTNVSTWSRGDIVLATAADTIGALTVGTIGQMLYSDGTDPYWDDAPASVAAFSTMNAPNGTDPVASVSTTLNWTSSGGTIDITGNSTTTTMNLDLPAAQTLPAATLNNSLRGDGSAWVANASFLIDSSGNTTHLDSVERRLGTGSDEVAKSDGANVSYVFANGSVEYNNQFATGNFSWLLGTDTNATWYDFGSASNAGIWKIFGNSTISSSLGNANNAFNVADGDGDTWLDLSPGPDNSMQFGNATDNCSAAFPGTGDLLLGGDASGAETDKTVYLGLIRWTNIGFCVWCENHSGVAISQYENVKFDTSGAYRVVGSPGLTDSNDVVRGIAQTPIGATPGDGGWVAIEGCLCCYGHNGGLLAIDENSPVFGKADGTLVGPSEVDGALTVNQVGIAMTAAAADEDFVLNFNSLVIA